MKRFPWIVAAVALVAFGVTYFEMQKARERYWHLALLQSHDHMHRDTRVFIIRAALAGLDRPIVVIGDSITEMARFPETIVNAGIGGATSSDFEQIAPLIFESASPSMIVVALGTNDSAASIRSDYPRLLSILKRFAPHLLAVAVTPQEDAEAKNVELRNAAAASGVPFVEPQMADGSTIADHIHLTNAASREWVSLLIEAICFSQPSPARR